MRVAVIGAGAMGSLISYLLDGEGVELVLYESRSERVADLRSNGIHLRGAVEGRGFPEVRSPGETVHPFDLIILAVAAGNAAAALRPLSPFVHRETLYLSFQDGSAVEELAQLVGDERAGGSVLRVSAVETSSGEVDVEEFRSLVVGGFLPAAGAGLVPLVDKINSRYAGGAELASDLGCEIWKRLGSAAAVSGLCGVLGGAPEEIKGLPEVDAMCGEAVEECRSVDDSAGAGFPAPGSPWEDAVWRWIKPPLLRDLEAMRRTEVDFLSGHIVKRARALGKSTPVNGALYSLIKEMETGERRPGENSFKELQRRVEEERGMRLL